jgi:Flp pilus assembly protein TadG
LTERRTDRGEVSVETVLVVPAIMFVVLLVVQAAVVMHAANIAHHVAAQGAMSAARHGSSPEEALVAISTAATAVGARLAAPPFITGTADDVTVRVWVALPRAVPMFAEQISREVSVPRERYIVYNDR